MCFFYSLQCNLPKVRFVVLTRRDGGGNANCILIKPERRKRGKSSRVKTETISRS